MKDIKEMLASEGFEGFVSVKDLKENFTAAAVPAVEGVYVVLRLKGSAPVFLEEGTGGFFKGKNPNVTTDVLESNWVDGEPVLYIGKAKSLSKRLKQYMQFGGCKPVGHYGGRYIWQLKDSDELIVCWRCVGNSLAVEASMIADFKDSHCGLRPFANLKG